MDLIDIVLARRKSLDDISTILSTIDHAQIQDFVGAIDAVIAHKADELGIEDLASVEDLVIKIKELEASKPPKSYGVEWSYSDSLTTLTRTGYAALFSDPSPATTLNGSGTSPFDTIAPWKNMKRYNVIDGTIAFSEKDASFSETDYDTVVYIPVFYYATSQDTDTHKRTWSISPTPQSGYVRHPGSGRYVGRFFTSGDSFGVFSKSGATPLVSATRGEFRTYSSNKGTKWQQLDLATWSAIQMLYIVEFANWDSETILGKGYDSSNLINTGETSNSTYHTIKGINSSNCYRWIENPFGGLFTFIDGVLLSDKEVYINLNNPTASDEVANMTDSGILLPNNGFISDLAYPVGYPWLFVPNAAAGTASSYITDHIGAGSGLRAVCVGGDYSGNEGSCGFFCFNGTYQLNDKSTHISSRLQYTP